MCGISGIFGNGWRQAQLEAMVASLRHRGPDDEGVLLDATGAAGIAHNRLSIIDLSAAGHQPMANRDGTQWIVFNGEIYNYRELRAELGDYPFRSQTDTEVILAAYERWGAACLDRFLGMFAFLIWDSRHRRLFAARDRFGVKPLYYHVTPQGLLFLASEIKALHAAGVASEPDPVMWATYLTYGLQDHSPKTFWRDVQSLPPGHWLAWEDGRTEISRWYDLAERIGPDFDNQPLDQTQQEYFHLLTDSVRLRFRSDVPVGINLSGGLDSSALLGLVQTVQGKESAVQAYTFVTGDPRYDELPWVKQMLAHTRHPSRVCLLEANQVPELAQSVQSFQDEPFGGLPTLAYARLFDCARSDGTIVLLDGQGMDEQWCGYDYYRAGSGGGAAAIVQGMKSSPVRPECLAPEFRALAEPLEVASPFPDRLRNLQYRDLRYTKIPRALRFNDRVSMRASTELREPFLDHRLVELAFRQLPERKIVNGTSKWLLRELAQRLLPGGVVEAPKRALQTPQREWLRGPLREWAQWRLQAAVEGQGGSWIEGSRLKSAWKEYCDGGADNSFFVWQWIGLGMMAERTVATNG